MIHLSCLDRAKWLKDRLILLRLFRNSNAPDGDYRGNIQLTQDNHTAFLDMENEEIRVAFVDLIKIQETAFIKQLNEIGFDVSPIVRRPNEH